MSARVILPVLVIAVGLPAFIFYSIFSGDPRPEMRPIANFENYQKDITRLSNDRYQVLGVIDEGGLLRVNVWFQKSSIFSVGSPHPGAEYSLRCSIRCRPEALGQCLDLSGSGS